MRGRNGWVEELGLTFEPLFHEMNGTQKRLG